MSVSQIVLTIVIAAATGIASALVTPWAHWGVEKRKLQRERRQAVLKNAREHMLHPFSLYCTFRQSSEYPLLRPHLPAELVAEIGAYPQRKLGEHGDRDHISHQRKLLDALAKVEAKWGLI